jgi:hypothetical protein
MDEKESNIQSFIVRVWVEDRAEEAGRGTWRGQITHVSSGQRRYFENLNEIPDFIAPSLEAMGMKLGMRWCLRRWLKRLTSRG